MSLAAHSAIDWRLNHWGLRGPLDTLYGRANVADAVIYAASQHDEDEELGSSDVNYLVDVAVRAVGAPSLFSVEGGYAGYAVLLNEQVAAQAPHTLDLKIYVYPSPNVPGWFEASTRVDITTYIELGETRQVALSKLYARLADRCDL